MFDYKKFLDAYRNSGDGNLKIDYCGEEEIDIYGAKNDLLYLASRILKFVEEDCCDGVPAETNMDATIDYEGNIRRVCVFLENNDVR